ncbi:MAG: PhzF family phenazine biosynthesis protein [Lachnospiraceae bacterium]|nr:PhzF family phenazine biosynthesis protein [Lachnospiraceae bacterium]
MRQFIVDAFTDTVFKGNPAAVCVMEDWIPKSLMMSITLENNFSETAFAVKEGPAYRLRWFTPGGEIDLCGHATLAAAYVILRFYEPGQNTVIFQTMSGQLTVKKEGELYKMNFPAYELKQVPVSRQMVEAIGCVPVEAWMGRDLLCVFDDNRFIRTINPDQDRIKNLNGLILHITAPGKETDCISRSFAPKCGVNEDPVCGSGHCHIAPYWAKRLNKTNIVAFQASKRGGTLYCNVSEGRVTLAGKAALYAISDLIMEGINSIPKESSQEEVS